MTVLALYKLLQIRYTFFTVAIDAQQYSYNIAENYKHEKLVEKWKDFIEEVLND